MDAMKLVESLSPLERKEVFDILYENKHLWTTTVAPKTCGGCCNTTKYPVTTTPDPTTLTSDILDLYNA